MDTMVTILFLVSFFGTYLGCIWECRSNNDVMVKLSFFAASLISIIILSLQ